MKKVYVVTPTDIPSEHFDNYRKKQIAITKIIYGDDTEIIDLPDISSSDSEIIALSKHLQKLAEADLICLHWSGMDCKTDLLQEMIFDVARRRDMDRLLCPRFPEDDYRLDNEFRSAVDSYNANRKVTHED